MSQDAPPQAVGLDWNPTHRLVPSRFPPVSLFDDVATAQELDVVFAIQNLTHPRLRQELGEISLVPAAERVLGPGSTPLMAAFCHLNPEGSRFSDGTWGVYYGASTLEAAVAEVSHHRARFLAATQQPAIEYDMRSYQADVREPLHDLRGPHWSALHAPDDYAPAQALARQLRAQGSWGAVYHSVRAPGAQCIAAFRPRALTIPRQGPHITLRWDGQAITGWYRKSGLRAL